MSKMKLETSGEARKQTDPVSAPLDAEPATDTTKKNLMIATSSSFIEYWQRDWRSTQGFDLPPPFRIFLGPWLSKPEAIAQRNAWADFILNKLMMHPDWPTAYGPPSACSPVRHQIADTLDNYINVYVQYPIMWAQEDKQKLEQRLVSFLRNNDFVEVRELSVPWRSEFRPIDLDADVASIDVYGLDGRTAVIQPSMPAASPAQGMVSQPTLSMQLQARDDEAPEHERVSSAPLMTGDMVQEQKPMTTGYLLPEEDADLPAFLKDEEPRPGNH